LVGICHRMGAERINLCLLTHIADGGQGKSATALCTENASAFNGYFLAKLDPHSVVQLLHDLSILTIFPHDRRPLMSGALLGLLARERIYPIGMASSPSALSILTPLADTRKMIDGLFRAFEFPDYCSPLEWQAAYLGKEQMFRDVVGSYEEDAIKVYAVLDEPELDLWTVRLRPRWMEQMGMALKDLDDLGMRMPFFVAHSDPHGDLILALCLASPCRDEMHRVIDKRVPYAVSSVNEAGAVFLHGPHFGDRHRIANALASSLHEAQIKPLAVSCTVHSISVILRAQDLHAGVKAIATRFHVP
jgi:hypothetical protein